MGADQQWLVQALTKLDNKILSVGTTSLPGLDRILATSGKRQRPRLIFQIVHTAGKSIDDKVIDGASAIELVHIASLIHDDIADKEQLRRGVQTISAAEGTDMALLAGDYLLAKACSFAAAVDAESGRLLAETIAQMCMGQAQEIRSRYDITRTKQHLIDTIEGKTASLFVAAAKLGGLFAGLGKSDREAVATFAQQYGIMYQLYNDIQDFHKSKTEGNSITMFDYEVGNYTLPILLALHDKSKNSMQQVLSKGSVKQQLTSFLKEHGYFTRAETEIDRYRQNALNAAYTVPSKKLVCALEEFLAIGSDLKK